VAGVATGEVIYTFKFSEGVSGFDQSKLALVNGVISSFEKKSETEYRVVVKPKANVEGDLGLQVSIVGVRDAAGNQAVWDTSKVILKDGFSGVNVLESDYTNLAQVQGSGTVAITKQMPDWGFASRVGRTGSDDKFLMVDGATNTGMAFWKTSAELVRGQKYEFSFWVNANDSVPLEFRVNGQVVASTLQTVTKGGWQQMKVEFVAQTQGSAKLALHSLSNKSSMNDFAIDDIELKALELTSFTVSQAIDTKVPVLALLKAILSDLTPTEVGTLDPEQLAKWSNAQLKGLSAEQVSALTRAQFQVLSALQIQQLNAVGLTVTQLGYVDKIAKTVLSDLTPTQVSALEPKQLTKLSNAQLKELSAEQVSALTRAQFQVLSALQIQQLNAVGLTVTQLGYVDKIGKTVLSDLTPTQVGVLDLKIFDVATKAVGEAFVKARYVYLRKNEGVAEHLAFSEVKIEGVNGEDLTKGAKVKSCTSYDNVWHDELNAIDGKTDIASGIFASQTTSNGWLVIELPEAVEIAKVTIFGRTDGASNQNGNYTVAFSTEKDALLKPLPLGPEIRGEDKDPLANYVGKTISEIKMDSRVVYYEQEGTGGPMQVEITTSTQLIQGEPGTPMVDARYVCIRKNDFFNEHLSIGEVQVLATDGTNLTQAPGTQIKSSTSFDAGWHYTTNAIDGHADTASGISASLTRDGGWLEIDLGAVKNIAQLNIFGRSDGGSYQNGDYTVAFSNISIAGKTTEEIKKQAGIKYFVQNGTGSILVQVNSWDLITSISGSAPTLNPKPLTNLSDAQLKGLSAEQVSALTQVQFQALSGVQIKLLNAEGLTATQLGYADKYGKMVLSDLKPTQVGALNPTQLTNLSGTQLKALSAEQVSALTQTQFRVLSTQKIQQINAAGLTVAQLRYVDKFNKMVLSDLTPTQLSQLSADTCVNIADDLILTYFNKLMIRQLNVSKFTLRQLNFFIINGKTVFSALSGKQLQTIDNDIIKTIPNQMVQTLTEYQVMGIDAVKIKNLKSDGFINQQLNFLDKNGFSIWEDLDNNQIKLLQPIPLTNLAIKYVSKISAIQIASMDDYQIKYLNAKGLTYDQLLYKNSANNEVFNLLTPAQFSALGVSVVGALTSREIGLMSDEKTQALNGRGITLAQLDYINIANNTVLSRLTNIQLAVLSESVVSALTLKQIGSMTDERVKYLNAKYLTYAQLSYANKLNNTVLSLLSMAQYLNLSPLLISKFTQAQIFTFSEQQIKSLNAMGLSYIQLSYLSKNNYKILSLLSAEQLTKLTIAVVAQLTSVDIASMDDLQIQALNGGGVVSAQLEYTNSSGQKVLTLLTKYQCAALSATLVGELTLTQISSMSDEKIQALNGSGLTSVQLKYTNSSGKMVLSLLIKKQRAALSAAVVAALTTTQIGSMSDMQIQALNGEGVTLDQLEYTNSSGQMVLNLLTKEQCAALSAAVVGRLTSTQIRLMTDEQIKALNVEYFNYKQLSYATRANSIVLTLLSKEQCSVLNVDVILDFTNDQLSKLSITQTSGLTKLQIAVMSDLQVKALNASGLDYEQLTYTNIENHAVLGLLRMEQLSELTIMVVAQLTSVDIASMSDEQIRVLIGHGLVSAQLEYTNNSGKKLLQLLTKDQTAALNATVVGALTSTKIGLMSDEQIQALNSEDLKYAQLSYLNKRDHAVLSLLNTTQLANLSGAIVRELTSLQIATLDNIKISYLNGFGFNQSLLDYKSSENKSVLELMTKNQFEAYTKFNNYPFSINQISMLSVSQVRWFTEGQVRKLTLEKIEIMLDGQIQALNGAGLTSAQLGYTNGSGREVLQLLTKEQSAALRIEVVGALTSIQIGLMSNEKIQTLNGSGLTSAQLKYTNNSEKMVLSLLTKEQCAALSAAVVGALTSTQVGSMSDEQIQALNGEGVTSDQLEYTNNSGKKVLQLLTKNQFAALNTKVVGALTSIQIGLMSDEEIQVLNGNGLTSKQLEYTTSSATRVLMLLTQEQYAALSASLVSALASTQIGSMSDEQVQAMEASGITTLQLDYKNQSNKTLFELMTNLQLSDLSVINELSAQKIRALTVAQFKYLTVLQISKLTNLQIKEMSDEHVQALKANGFTAEQLSMVNKNGKTVLSLLAPESIKNIDCNYFEFNSNYKYLTKEQVAALSVKIIPLLSSNALYYLHNYLTNEQYLEIKAYQLYDRTVTATVTYVQVYKQWGIKTVVTERPINEYLLSENNAKKLSEATIGDLPWFALVGGFNYTTTWPTGFLMSGVDFQKSSMTPVRYLTISQLKAVDSNQWYKINFGYISDFSGEKLSAIGRDGKSIISHYGGYQLRLLTAAQVSTLASDVLIEKDKDGILILQSIYDKLSSDQIGSLDSLFFSLEVNVAGSRRNLIDVLSETQLLGITNNQIINFSDDVKISFINNLKLFPKIKSNYLINVKPPKYVSSKILSLYGAVVADLSFRGLQFSNYLDATKNFSVAAQGNVNNFYNSQNNNFLSLQTQLERFKASRTGAVSNVVIDGGVAAQVLQVIVATARWHEDGYGKTKGKEATDANAFNAYFVSASLAFKIAAAFQQANADLKASNDGVSDNEELGKAIGGYLTGVGTSLKLMANLGRVLGFSSLASFESAESFGGVYLFADVLGIAGNITTMASKKSANSDADKYGLAVQIFSLVGGAIVGGVNIASGVLMRNIGLCIADATAGLNNSVGLACDALMESGYTVTESMRACETVDDLLQNIKNSMTAAEGVSRATGGIMLLLLAANPAPYLQAKAVQDSAAQLRLEADAQQKLGAEYTGNYIYADALDDYADVIIGYAAANTALLALQAISVFAGAMMASTIFGAIAAIVGLSQQAAYDAKRISAASKIGGNDGLQKIYNQHLADNNRLQMNGIMSNYPNLLRDFGFSSLTLFGGQALSEVAVSLGLYAADDGITPLFAQKDIKTTANFANTITSDNAQKYTTKVNVFDGTYAVNGEAFQTADLTEFIQRSGKTAESNPLYSGILFYNPILLPTVNINSAQFVESGGKSTTVVKYLTESFSGIEFNLAASDLSRSEFVSLDLINLLVNFVANDANNNAKTVYIRNKILLGNSQYYIYGSLANMNFLNANTNSGKGVAIVDYSKLSETGYDASIQMKMSSNYICINKNLALTSSSSYYQENNSGSTTVTSGKRSVTTKYIKFEEIKGAKLDNQSDLIYGDSCVNSVVMPDGYGNILTGYNGWTLEGGQAAQYYFNRYSNNFNKNSTQDYTPIHIIQGSRIIINTDGEIDSDVSSMSIVSIESLMDFRDVYFYLGEDLRDLQIVNTETQQKYIIYNFMKNSLNNIIYLSEGVNSYCISGEALAAYFRTSALEVNLFTGISVQANSSLMSRLVNYEQIGTNVLIGSLLDGGVVLDNSKYNILDYSSMAGSISADISMGRSYKFNDANNYCGFDNITGIEMLFGTSSSDSYLNINKSVAISDFKGNDFFSIKTGGDLQVSGLLDVQKELCTQEYQVYVDDLSSMDFYVDFSKNLHIISMDDDNHFSILINQYADLEKGACVNGNLLLNIYSRSDGASLGYLAVSDINGLIDKMASMHSPINSTGWVSSDYSGFLKPLP
jgi:hypothetical protein